MSPWLPLPLLLSVLLRQAPNRRSESPGSRIPCLVLQPHHAVLLIQLRLVSQFSWPSRSRWRWRGSSPAPLLACEEHSNPAVWPARPDTRSVPGSALCGIRLVLASGCSPWGPGGGTGRVRPGEAPSPTSYRSGTVSFRSQFPDGSQPPPRQAPWAQTTWPVSSGTPAGLHLGCSLFLGGGLRVRQHHPRQSGRTALRYPGGGCGVDGIGVRRL